jgi:hypothetical protein
LDSAASKKLDLGKASPGAGFWDRRTILTPYTRFLFHYHLVPYLQITLAAILSLASVCIVWSEVVKGIFPQLSVIRYSVIHHQASGKGQVGLAGQVIAALWMVYMCAASLISITEVKVWRGRALVRRNTAHESAFWYASQVARLSVPLTYNFMTFLGSIYRDTVFYDFLGQLINLTPLWKWFDYLFPVFILVPVCATLFGLYGKVKRVVGFGVIDALDDDDDVDANGPDGIPAYGSGSWREGRDLIERELNGSSAAIRARRGDVPSSSNRSAPVLSIPRSGGGDRGGGGPTTPFGTSPTGGLGVGPSGSRPQANTSARRVGRPPAAALDDGGDDENFFEAFGHRVKNTIDTFDTPKWFTDIGQGIKKPRWMGGDGDGDGGGQQGGSGTGGWFGSGEGEGRIRL